MDKEYFASINEASKRLSVPAYTLRYWEKQFPTAIKPTTGAGGRRYYRTEVFNKLAVIKELLYTRGMTIAGVKKLLRDGNLPASADEFVSAMNSGTDEQPIAAPQNATKVNTQQLDLAIDLLKQAHNVLKTV